MTFQGMDQGHEDARPTGPDRMSQSDRTAVDVDLGQVDLKPFGTAQQLRGERLVDLVEIDLIRREPSLAQHRANRTNRGEKEVARVETRDRRRQDSREGSNLQLRVPSPPR